MKKAHFILKSFYKLKPSLFSVLYKTFIRPVIEYCSSVSRPCYPSFIARLETCQRRLTKWCSPIRNFPYHERLEILKLPTIEKRFKRGDLILTYQILNQQFNITPSDFFCFAETNTRGHSFKLAGSNSKLNIRHRFFTNRVVSHWNSLSTHIVSAPSVNAFKARLDRVL